jgi:hypothetical protein
VVDRDEDGDAIDEHAYHFAERAAMLASDEDPIEYLRRRAREVEQPEPEAPTAPKRSFRKEHADEPAFTALKWDRWGSDTHLRAMYLALSDLAEKHVQGPEHTGPKPPPPPRSEPFASVSHALTELAVDRLDGVSGGRTAGAFLLEINRWGTRIQWSSKAGSPPAIDHAEKLHHVRQAFALAFAEMPGMCSLLRAECELVTMWRYVGVLRPVPEAVKPPKGERRLPMRGATREEAPRKGPPVLEFVRLKPEEIATKLIEEMRIEVSPRQIGRITRWGAARVYEHLRERELVQCEQSDETYRYRGKAAGTMADGVSVFGNDLLGWTAIAKFLEVSERTAQSYANADEAKAAGREPMPVMRLPTRTEASRAVIRRWAETNLLGKSA